MRACVFSQKPLVSETASLSGGTSPAKEAQTSPKYFDGVASTTMSASCTAVARSAVQRMHGGNSTPGK